MLALVLVLASVAVPRQAVAVTATTGWTLKGMMAVLQTMELLTVLRWELRSRQRGMCSGTLRACACGCGAVFASVAMDVSVAHVRAAVCHRCLTTACECPRPPAHTAKLWSSCTPVTRCDAGCTGWKLRPVTMHEPARRSCRPFAELLLPVVPTPPPHRVPSATTRVWQTQRCGRHCKARVWRAICSQRRVLAPPLLDGKSLLRLARLNKVRCLPLCGSVFQLCVAFTLTIVADGAAASEPGYLFGPCERLVDDFTGAAQRLVFV